MTDGAMEADAAEAGVNETGATSEAADSGAARAFLGLGSNMGESRAFLARAVAALAATPDIRVVGVSRLYRSAPIGFADQPDFVNLVVELEVTLSPLSLLDIAQALENEAGRERTVRFGPRTLDVDVLWYDGTFIDDERLQVPHPRMEERRFVLEPLAELAPDLVLAGGRTVEEALASTRDQAVQAIGPGKE